MHGMARLQDMSHVCSSASVQIHAMSTADAISITAHSVSCAMCQETHTAALCCCSLPMESTRKVELFLGLQDSQVCSYPLLRGCLPTYCKSGKTNV